MSLKILSDGNREIFGKDGKIYERRRMFGYTITQDVTEEYLNNKQTQGIEQAEETKQVQEIKQTQDKEMYLEMTRYVPGSDAVVTESFKLKRKPSVRRIRSSFQAIINNDQVTVEIPKRIESTISSPEEKRSLKGYIRDKDIKIIAEKRDKNARTPKKDLLQREGP